MKTVVCNYEAARLKALHQYQILDTAPEQAFDDLVFLAAQICDTPIALINFIDANRQWFKAKVGLDIQQMPLNMGFCRFCLEQKDTLVIPDTLLDVRFSTEVVVISEPHVRFYAGVPLFAPGGEVIGTVSIVDSTPREISPKHLESLQAISRLIVRQLEIRRNLAELSYIKTEYQQAQVALHQSKSTLHSFFDSAPMMMGIVELVDHDILHISDNLSAARFFGLTSEATQNCCEQEIGTAHLCLQQWRHYFQQAEQTQSPVRFEDVYDTPQGRKWLSATISLIAGSSSERFSQGDATRSQFAYILEDISERQQAQEQLRWKETLLHSMNSVSPLAFYVVDKYTDNILYFNDRFCEIWGITHLKTLMEQGELQHQDILPEVFKSVVDIPSFVNSCQVLQQTDDDCCVVEDEIALTNGRTIRRFSTQICDRYNQYCVRLYIFEDITDRKQTEQKFREQAALLDVATDAIILQDLSDIILLWNQSAVNLYGWKTAEAIGKNANQLLNHGSSSPYSEIRNTVLKSGHWQGELHKTNRVGKELIVESRWTLVRDEHNQAKSILVVDTDITQRKQLEKQFLRTQRMESIGTLASGIAHDLNNVLSPILMSVQLLKNKATDQSNHQILSIIETNVKRGANLVKQVLSFVRGVEGDRTIIQVKHLITDIQQIIHQTFPKSIEFIAEIQPDLSPVCGDSTQLHQVLINLCVNARDAMPNGGTLSISAENIWIDEDNLQIHLDAQVGAYIVLTVSDDGTGINSALLDRIFEPFFTTKEFGKGTGLGLSTVIGIIKGHGGFITVSSCIDKGTTFKIYLPAVNTEITQVSADVEMPNGQGEMVLIVDDETAIQEITTSSLENHNYQAISANDGMEAIAIYTQNQNKISVAIIDMMMPNMDGATTIRTLQNLNSQLPIIAVSGLATSEQVLTNQSSGHITFLPKPYTTPELLQVLHKILHQQ
ncbi:PAS domain S-box protein [Fortiea sp. LEGE XX443]|uniref:hybrid sensor histidine kinase/response regulator n=1 Tax=Fortiea sp. LEGE XX443 TaxID=1828611 RepID=UPI00187FB79A|nr:PAS domain S-box protein [Fortiea sp. LEGE XX443]MBE9005418.1 PAS domain S-box protein [Fortiea sp. LEGE XX443]